MSKKKSHTLSRTKSNISRPTACSVTRIDSESKITSTSVETAYENATGKIAYNFTNDYMFRTILQSNKTVLKGLICALLHLDPKCVTDITINNPIELGKSIDNKEFILDINITLNNNTRINLEMQVENELNWPDRSLSYLCRTFDQLYRGQNYAVVSPVIHIGFLNYTLFPLIPEFYATFKLLNIKTQEVFNDKFTLCVIDLTQIDTATEEDRFYQIDRWARLFKATTWQEIRNLSKGDDYMAQAAKELYKCNADDLIQQQCLAREEYYRQQRTLHKAIKDATEERNRLAVENAEKEKIIAEKEKIIAEKETEKAELLKQIAELKKQLPSD